MRHKLTIVLLAGLAAGTFLVHQNYITLPGNGNQVVRQSTDSIASQLDDSWDRLTAVLKSKGQSINWPNTTAQIDSSPAVQKTTQDQSPDSNATPIESIVSGKTLSNVYYYQFQSGLPAEAKQLFQSAVNSYNATGIVRLIPGNDSGTQNRIIFGFYRANSGSTTYSKAVRSYDDSLSRLLFSLVSPMLYKDLTVMQDMLVMIKSYLLDHLNAENQMNYLFYEGMYWIAIGERKKGIAQTDKMIQIAADLAINKHDQSAEDSRAWRDAFIKNLDDDQSQPVWLFSIML
ncbi:hypothetical protein [Oenococcus sicerae]|uniref:Uncharacterized protein n=1 Tax=Oenococcus sicerae TaxID=2203724 RepID=A0AAJ1R9S1_9LACO|nr:hypothetical protein [Oenococcus sicerae]MDN6899855.1 hypothetical protein [Oenococcus sicerae]